MNKSLFKVLLVLGIIISMSLITALSCNKVGDDKNNANNNNNNSGGGGDKIPQEPAIKFENFDTSVAEMVGDTIQLKAGGFPKAAISANIADKDIRDIIVGRVASDSTKRAFDITITSGGSSATGGLLLVGPGNLADANAFSIGLGVANRVDDYSDALRKEGITSQLPIGSWTIYGSFMKDQNPTSAAEAAADASPFAFSASTGSYAIKPIFFCRTAISAITTHLVVNDPGAVQASTKLTGGQKASCYVGAAGDVTVKARDIWLKTAASDTFKKKFNIAVAGVRTDDKTIVNIGLPGADDAAKVAAFKNGISTAEMEKIVAANTSAYKKVAIELVRGTLNSVPPEITVIPELNFDRDRTPRVVVDGDTIKIKASSFPSSYFADTATLKAGAGTLRINDRVRYPKVFSLAVEVDGTIGTGGLTLVGPGNIAALTNFKTDPMNKMLSSYSDDEVREGIVNIEPFNIGVGSDTFLANGWNVFGTFMNTNNPTGPAEAGAGVSPFAFSATTGTFATKPILICFMNVSTITSVVGVQDTTRLTGGHQADCHVTALGDSFTGGNADAWLKAVESNTFKKKFEIAVMGIRTDNVSIGDMGLTGNSAEFVNGLTGAELKQLADNNPSAYKKFTVEIIRDAGFTYTAPATGNIVITPVNNADVTINGNDIEIKASAFPATAATADMAAGIDDLAGVPAGSLKHIFDITISGGTGTPTGGLVMVGPGNITKIGDFEDTTGGHNVNFTANEGFGSDRANTTDDGSYTLNGWNHYGVFMNNTAPTSQDADASPFAFTATTGGNASQPFLFCRSTIAGVEAPLILGLGLPMTGGHTASCYIGSKGTAFNDATNPQAATWTGTTASSTFKKKFNISIGAFRTDNINVTKLFKSITVQDGARAFYDGFSKAEVEYIAARYTSAFRKVSVTIVP